MTDKVTIEGSIQPSDQLARGERRTVALTPRVQRLIDRGFVVVVDDNPAPPLTDDDDFADAPEPEGGHPEVVEPPALNRSRDEWAAFLDQLEPPVAYTDDDGRDDLVRLWQGSQQS